MDSFNAAKQAPESWFMPDVVTPKPIEDIKENEAPF